MNHGQLAREALRYRMHTVRPALVDPTRFDLDRAAEVAVASGDPIIDRALRTIGSALLEAGLGRDDLTHPWHDPAVHELFLRRPELVDALDDIVDRVVRLAPCT